MESYEAFVERCRRKGDQPKFSHEVLGDFFYLSETLAKTVAVPQGYSEEKFVEECGDFAALQDAIRHCREDEVQDTPELRKAEEEYADALGVSREALSAQRVREGRRQ